MVVQITEVCWKETKFIVRRTIDFLENSNQIHGITQMHRYILFGCNLASLFVFLAIFIIYAENLSFKYSWWPFIECIRIGLLTIARMDRLIPEDRVFMDDSKVRKIIGYGNVAGFIWAFPFWVLYALLLTGESEQTIVFVICTSLFLIIRLINSLPCSFHLLEYIASYVYCPIPILQAMQTTPESPYRSFHAPRRVTPEQNDIESNYNFDYVQAVQYSPSNPSERQIYGQSPDRDSNQNQNQDNSNNNNDNEFEISPRTLQAQQELFAAAQDRILRKKQDEEYEAALAMAQKNEELNKNLFPEFNNNNVNNVSDTIIKNNDDSENENEIVEIIHEKEETPIPELTPEPSKMVGVIIVRYKLPNGQSLTRNFNGDCPIIKLYHFLDLCKIEWNGSILKSRNYFLVSNFPREKYDDLQELIKNTSVLKDGSKDESGAKVSPLLYIEFKSESVSPTPM